MDISDKVMKLSLISVYFYPQSTFNNPLGICIVINVSIMSRKC